MVNNRKKGFTLVELLAVIVILAIILVIAVPQIMTTINDATKASFESSAKMVASQVENQYTVAQTLGKPFNSTGSCMEEWAGLNETDYESCRYEIKSDGTAKVTLTGKGKFKDLNVCEGTRNSATSQENSCVRETPAECFTFDDQTGTITGYDISCGTDVVIPSEINGVDVVAIGDESFMNLGITSVKFPNTLEDIYSGAFLDNNILEIEIPSSVIFIGSSAFNNNLLTVVKLNNLNAEIGCGAFGYIDSVVHNLPDSYSCVVS